MTLEPFRELGPLNITAMGLLKYLPSLISIFFYAGGNYIISTRLAKTNPTYVVAAYSGIMFLASLALLFILMVAFKSTKYEVVMPSKAEFFDSVQVGFIYVVADILLTFGYTLGVSLMFSTSCYALIPLAAIIIRFFRDGVLPNFYYILACVTAIITLMLVTQGDKQSAGPTP